MINAALLIALHTRPDLHAWSDPVVEMREYHRLTAMRQRRAAQVGEDRA